MLKMQTRRLGNVAPFKYGKSLTAERRLSGQYDVYSSAGVCGRSNLYLANEGIIIGRKGSIGTVFYSKTPFYCIDTTFYIDRVAEDCDMKYIFYYLKLLHLEKYNTDAAVPGLNRSLAEKLKLCIPDLPTQQRIADILSSYDDLIENNNRRIALLEQAAQELYKEWFVRFRFPGYENTKFENGLPCGWEVVRLGDYVDIKGGKRLPAGKILCEQPTAHPYIRIRDLCDSKFVSLTNAFQYIDDSTYDIIRRFTVETGDILISIVGTIGALCCVGKSLNGANLTENCVKLVNPKMLTHNYIYHFLHSEAGKAAINAGIVGATQPKLPLYNIKRIKLVKPDETILSKFESYLHPVNRELMTLQDSNLRLARQRDLLLPRLMNGQWEV